MGCQLLNYSTKYVLCHRLLKNTHTKQTSLVVHAPCENAIRQGYISDKSTVDVVQT